MIQYVIRPNFDTCYKIAQSLYGDKSRIEFTERYVPEIERFEEPKIEVVTNYLNKDASIKHLWAIQDDTSSNEIGYILIADLPHENSIGYSIDVNYSNHGIMSKSLKQVLDSISNSDFVRPIHVHTLIENEPSNRLLRSLGFRFNGIIKDDIIGEHNHYSW
jgi:RimJ/RimL family protein N-acetyltransferase